MAGFDSINDALDKLENALFGKDEYWRKKLRNGAFGAATFETLDSSLRSRRSVSINDAPGTDQYTLEDLGKSGTPFGMTIFVIGRDYLKRRNTLIAELDAGRRMLIHPTLGEFECYCVSYDMVESADRGGIAVFDCEFIRVFPQIFEVDVPSKKAGLLDDAAAVLNAATDFVTNALDTVGRPAAILNRAINKIKGEIRAAKSKIKGSYNSAVNAWADLEDNIETLIEDTADLTETILFGCVSIQEADSCYVLSVNAGMYQNESGTDLDRAVTRNDNALNRAFTAGYLASACTAIANNPPDTKAKASNLRFLIGQRIQSEMETPGLSDDYFNSLKKMLGSMSEYIDSISFNLPDVYVVELARPVNIFEVAYRLYGDAERALEIIEFNDIPNPMYASNQSLSLLSR